MNSIRDDRELKELWVNSLSQSKVENIEEQHSDAVFDALDVAGTHNAPDHLRQKLCYPEDLASKGIRLAPLEPPRRWVLPAAALLLLVALAPLLAKRSYLTTPAQVSDEFIIDAIFNVTDEDAFSTDVFSHELSILEEIL